jgi:hypothetical protein
MAPQGSDTRRVPEQCARCRTSFRIEKDIFSGELAGSVLAPEIPSHGPIDRKELNLPLSRTRPWARGTEFSLPMIHLNCTASRESHVVIKIEFPINRERVAAP